MKEITHCGNIDSTIILESLSMQSEELGKESWLTKVVAMKKMMLMLSKGSDVSKNKQTNKQTSQLKELLAIFHVFEHRKDKTISYPNLERSVTISSV